MAKEMHHLNVGDQSFEIVDATARRDVAAESSRIDQYLDNHNTIETELWTGAAKITNTVMNLSDDVSNFDYIDVYCTFFGRSQIFTFSTEDISDIHIRIENLPDDASSQGLGITEFKVQVIDDVMTLLSHTRFYWNFANGTSFPTVTNAVAGDDSGDIIKVVGRKIVTNDEVVDIRVGTDGTTYSSAGVAVRTQINALSDEITNSIGSAESAAEAAQEAAEEARNFAEARFETDPTLSAHGIAADAKATGDAIDILNNGGLILKNDVIQAEIDNWLDNHPEATTTVQDESLTYKKLVKGTLGFVTPEMYGAVGDAVADDTNAIQSAVTSGKPILLMNNYKCGKVTGENIIVIGNGKTIINKSAETLFSTTGNCICENLTIENPEQFDYEQSKDLYATIAGLNVHCSNVKIINVNSIGIYASGDCIVKSCIMDNHNFDVKTTYDGTLSNHSFGVYVHQTSATKIVSVRDSQFSYLIEGVYFGSYSDTPTEIIVDNNYFYYVADHCTYINSYEDRSGAVISNNLCVRCSVAFATVGNNHLICGNKVLNAYDGTRECFGFSIRDGSNVTYRNNVFVSGQFTTIRGTPTNCQITSILTNTKRDNIVFDSNVFDFTDAGNTALWLRMGYNKNAELGNVIFKNNKMTIKGGVNGIGSNVNVNLVMKNNIITVNQAFMSLSAGIVDLEENEITNTETTSIFSIASYGTYLNNKFNCKVAPLRRGSDVKFVVGGNVNIYSGIGIYNLVAQGKTGVEYKGIKKGEFTAIATGANVVDFDIMPQFDNKLLVFNSSGQQVTFTVDQIRVGAIDISNLPAGSYKYVLF